MYSATSCEVVDQRRFTVQIQCNNAKKLAHFKSTKVRCTTAGTCAKLVSQVGITFIVYLFQLWLSFMTSIGQNFVK